MSKRLLVVALLSLPLSACGGCGRKSAADRPDSSDTDYVAPHEGGVFRGNRGRIRPRAPMIRVNPSGDVPATPPSPTASAPPPQAP